MNRITLITSPDDVLADAFRILCVDLTIDQNQLVSNCITKLDFASNIVIYIWNTGEDVNWLFDKKQKSNIIVFNGMHNNGEIVGYLTAQANSYYFGPLKTLGAINDRDIYDIHSLEETLVNYVKKYEQNFK